MVVDNGSVTISIFAASKVKFVFPLVLVETRKMGRAERKKVDALEMCSCESVVDGERNYCLCARKHQTKMDTGIEGSTSNFRIACSCC